MTEALFHRCRKALGLSQPAIARALLIASDRTIGRWEQGELTVAGPAWVALEYLLRDSSEIALADRVAGVGRQRRHGNVCSLI
jgi:DNA-binding transcriptional regulator YiaG